MSVAIVWFRQDLRLSDNPALQAACEACDTVVPVFIDDPAANSVSQLGAASSVWLHHSLNALSESLREAGAELILAQGNALAVLQRLVAHTGATRLFWNRCYDPASIERDTAIKKALPELEPATFNASLLHEPWQVLKKDGTPYRVYTPFWRASSALHDQAASGYLPVESDGALARVRPLDSARSGWGDGEADIRFVASVDDFDWLPALDWHRSMMTHWRVGETAAQSRLDEFVSSAVERYDDARDLPGVQGTSCLSPHLHFGEISPRQILQRLRGGSSLGALSTGRTTFAKELIWRDFAYSLLFHFPHMPDEPLDRRFSRFPWIDDHEEALVAWQRGQTGVPIVDAGMRQLYATGWMHNRVRMIVGSYLVKNLLVPWQAGEAWFQDTLVDADLASNSMGWQWVSGCGADAAPFFRIFNPVLQGEKFDKSGEYVRRWVPELTELPNKLIHKPWERSGEARASIAYPEPLVDLKRSRQRALDAFSRIKTVR